MCWRPKTQSYLPLSKPVQCTNTFSAPTRVSLSASISTQSLPFKVPRKLSSNKTLCTLSRVFTYHLPAPPELPPALIPSVLLIPYSPRHQSPVSSVLTAAPQS